MANASIVFSGKRVNNGVLVVETAVGADPLDDDDGDGLRESMARAGAGRLRVVSSHRGSRSVRRLTCSSQRHARSLISCHRRRRARQMLVKDAAVVRVHVSAIPPRFPQARLTRIHSIASDTSLSACDTIKKVSRLALLEFESRHYSGGRRTVQAAQSFGQRRLDTF